MEIQPLQILFQLINFGLVMFLLVKFLYHPIAKVLSVRGEKIKAGLDAAEKNLAEKDKLATEVKNELVKARKEATKIIEDAKKQAKIEAQAIVDKAKEQAKKAGETEKKAFESILVEEQQKALSNLKTLVTQTTAKVLGAGLTDSDQHRIIDSQIRLLKDTKFE